MYGPSEQDMDVLMFFFWLGVAALVAIVIGAAYGLYWIVTHVTLRIA